MIVIKHEGAHARFVLFTLLRMQLYREKILNDP